MRKKKKKKKKSKILVNKLNKFPSKNAIVNFYWDGDMTGKSIKVKVYKKKKKKKKNLRKPGNFLRLIF